MVGPKISPYDRGQEQRGGILNSRWWPPWSLLLKLGSGEPAAGNNPGAYYKCRILGPPRPTELHCSESPRGPVCPLRFEKYWTS